MNFDFFSFDGIHLLGDSATHPIEPLATRLGRKLLLAGSSPLRRRAYPDAPPAADSGASNLEQRSRPTGQSSMHLATTLNLG